MVLCSRDINRIPYMKLHSALDSTSPDFAWYDKNPSIHELRTFGFDIYPITLYNKNLDYRTKEVLLIVYTNIRDTMKW